MRIIIFLLLIAFISTPVLSQPPSKYVPTKKEMQAQMLEAINELNNQISELFITPQKTNSADILAAIFYC